MTPDRYLGVQVQEQSPIPDLAAQKEKVKKIPVCIVNPASTFLADQRVMPPLGPAKVAAELAANNNPVSLLDCAGYDSGKITKAFMDSHPEVQVFGISATSPQMPEVVRIVEQIKTTNPYAKIILGGPHATLVNAAYQQDVAIGKERRGTRAFQKLTNMGVQIVAGDGEMSIFHAIDTDNNDPVIDAANRQSSLFMKRGSLEKFQFPARDMLQLDSYNYFITDPKTREKYRATSIIAQLGCPFGCGFCGGRNTDFLRMARFRSHENIGQEARATLGLSDSHEWQGEPLRGLMFYDDELNVNKAGLETLARDLISIQEETGKEMRFRGFTRADPHLFDEETANLMYDAGFREILSGFESGSDLILKSMRKGTSAEINTRFVQIAHNAGHSVKFLMSVGHPGETRETIQESVDWVLENARMGDTVDWSVITQYPGSPYYDESEEVASGVWAYTEPKTGLRLYSREIDYTEEPEFYKGVPGEYTPSVWTDDLTSMDLAKLRDQAEIITRTHLGLPPITRINPEEQFDHSMGQGLPPHVLRTANH